MHRKTMVCASCALMLIALGVIPEIAAQQPPLAGATVQTAPGATVQAAPGGPASSSLPKPERVLLYAFRVPEDVVTIDQSAAARLQRRRNQRRDMPTDDSLAAVTQEIQTSFTNTLQQELNAVPFPVEKWNGADSLPPNNSLLIQGEFTSVNQGNRSQRIMIGFGRGASDVQAQVVVSLKTGSQTIVLSQFTADTSSGIKPGAAVTMGVGSQTAGDKKATVSADASRMAKTVAKQVVDLMSSQKWIPAKDAEKATGQADH
jgi:hypothetical protein